MRSGRTLAAFAFLLLNFSTGDAQTSTIALAQHVGKDAGTTTSSTLSFPSSNTGGNWIGVVVRAGRTGQTFTVTDTRGNTYQKAIQLDETSDATSLALYYAENIAPGANTVTVSDNLTGGTLRFAIFEYSGVATSNSLDVATAAQGTSATPNSGNVTTVTPGDLVIGAVSTANAAIFTAGTGFTIQEQVPASWTKLIVEDLRQSTAGTISAGASLATSDIWGALVAAFKPASVVGPSDPSIGNVTPTTGSVGTAVTIAGLNFGETQGTGTVTFNGTLATPTTWSATSIVAPVPTGATTGNVVVTVNGVPSNPALFTVPVPPPAISTVNPASGEPGTVVTIAGANFGVTQGTSAVQFNGTLAVPSAWSDASITVPVPSGATSGPIVVTVGGQPSNGVAFTVPQPPPAITALNPTAGVVGTAVTITGTNFGAAQGTSTVTFNGTAAVPSNWSATSILVPVPVGATTGNIVVSVGGQASAGVAFTVLPPPAGITLVQHAGLDAGTTLSATLAFPASNTGGHWIGVAIRASQTDQNFSVTDTRGNLYRKALQLNEVTDGTSLALYYAENIAAGANTVTVANSVVGTLRFAIVEYAGVAQTNSLDVTTTAQGTSSTPDSGLATTTTPGDLVLGLVSTANGMTFTPGSGFTLQERVPASGTKLIVEDLRQAAPGPIAARATLSSSDHWGAALATFRDGGNVRPDLTVSKTHVDPFILGQTGATYTITVSNVGYAPTAGVVTVTESLPAGLTATAFDGAGWTCDLALLTCTRSDSLQPIAQYPPIILTVDVGSNIQPSVTNTASVSGGQDSNAADNSASDSTTIAVPDTEPPSAPGTLTATAVSGTQIDLQWAPATDNVQVTSYRVEQCQGAGCSIFVKLATVTGTTFSDTGLTPNTTYGYVVRAVDSSSLQGPYSNPASATTLTTIPELVAAYSFDEAAGSTVNDLSDKGNNGTLGTAVRTPAGKFGSALSFNGFNAKVTIPDAASLRLSGAMTLEAWVNPSAIDTTWRDVIQKGDDNYFLLATTSSGPPAAGGTFGGVNAYSLGPSNLPLNTWTHLAATYDGATLRLFVNGSQASSSPRTGNIALSASPLEIGGDSVFGQFFQGMIDEVRIFNVARTPTQIQSDMDTPISQSVPLVALSSVALDFGTQSTGSTTSPQTVSVTNIGGAPLTITDISISGLYPGDFAQTHTCGAVLAPAESCAVSATFTAGAAGGRSATIVIASNAPGAPHTVSLTGTGIGVTVSPQNAALTPGRTQQFTIDGTAIAWYVDGIEGGSPSVGTVTANGLYTAPSERGIHTVTAFTVDQSSHATVYVTTHAGVFTHHNDNFRTGQNLDEIVLTPQNVTAATFGKLASYPLDGNSHASPLYVAGVDIPGVGVRNVVYVATEHNSVYAFDADGLSPQPLWRVSFIDPAAGVTTVPSGETGECCDIAPEVGITGTPVIDPTSGTLYVVAKTKEVTGDVTNYRQRLHALDIATGAEKFGGPVVLQATVPGTGAGSQNGNLSFNALRHNQRPALLLSNGVVYIGFGSHGDVQPYHGWLLGYDARTLQLVMAHNSSPNNDGGGMWQANGGPAADEAGNIYYITGNGPFNAHTGGRSYGSSFVKINPAGTVLDYFTPHDQANLSSNNFDLGAAGPMLLPDQAGPNARLLVSAGKNNTVYLLNRDNMGGYNPSNDNQIVQSLVNIFPFGRPEPGNYSAPVYFNGTVYFGPVADTVQAFRLTNGVLSTTPTSASAVAFPYPGATLAISANGSTNGILWALQRNGDCGVQVNCSSAAPAVLRAYDASDLRSQLYASDQAGARDELDFAAKFSVPLVVNGKVFVTTVGRLTVYGLLR